MITVKITAGGKSTIQGTGKWSYAWINNAGETDIYATTVASDKTVSELITAYEAGGAKDIVKLPAGSSKRLRANNRPVIIFGAEAGMAEVDLTNTDVSPFKVQAKGGDDGNIEPISITANGTYTASGNVKGYSPVSVSVQPNVGTKNISDNGTYTASADQLDGYSSVTVAVSKDFYPKAHATLDDVSRVEGDDMRVYPMEGADYYPYVYLGAMPYPAQQGDDFEPCGKYFAGQTQEHTVTTFLDLIDVATGESVSGYPQRVAPNWSVSIVDGGYMKIVSWTVKASGAVSITTERYNPTYTKPLQDTKDSAAVTGGKLDDYVDAEYYIDGGVGESVRLDTLTVTANGTYTAPARTAYNEVNVNVPAPAMVSKYIRGNGIFSAADEHVAGYSDMIADVSPNDAFVTILEILQRGTEKLNCPNTEKKDALVMWGDGTETFGIQKDQTTHTYASTGIYAITVYPIDESLKDYSNFIGYHDIHASGGTTDRILHVKFPDNYTRIESEVWGGCYAGRFPHSISIPPIARMATSCFYGNDYLKQVYMRGTTPPALEAEDWQMPFYMCPNLEAIYVPASAVNAYKTASGWSTYADIIQPMPL